MICWGFIQLMIRSDICSATSHFAAVDMYPKLRSEVTMTPATEAYVRRIEEVAADSSLAYLLVAHQYTRYLGDLFGGQVAGNNGVYVDVHSCDMRAGFMLDIVVSIVV